MIQGVLSNAERHQQMALAMKTGYPRIHKKAHFSDRWTSLACYGPSLALTYRELARPIVSVSGAHDFLVDRGIVPDWHIDCDPREHKARMLKNPQQGCTYLMASVCHPVTWEILRGQKVRLWHLWNGNDFETLSWVAANDPGSEQQDLVGGGSTVGQRAMEVMGNLGFRRFHIHGMDCCFDGDARHAGAHEGKPQTKIPVRCGGRQFITSPQMMQAAQEMERFFLTYDVEVTLRGNGLVQEMLRQILLKEAA